MAHPAPRCFSRSSATLLAAVLATATLLSGCGTTTHRLPPYEPPIARTEFQTVRTTAYTHTESDHLAYTNHNALGGILHAASTPLFPGNSPAPTTDAPDASDIAEAIGGVGRVADVLPAPAAAPAPAAGRNRARPVARATPTARADDGNPPWVQAYLKRKQAEQQRQQGAFYVTPPARVSEAPVVYGSAAADWSRWPVGTIFRIETTGQIYKVDDYGWALAGRNTIDLYHATRGAMNAWGVRRVPIHVLRWGSREESLRRLRGHEKYKHIRRMVLELEGHSRAAARLE